MYQCHILLTLVKFLVARIVDAKAATGLALATLVKGVGKVWDPGVAQEPGRQSKG